MAVMALLWFAIRRSRPSPIFSASPLDTDVSHLDLSESLSQQKSPTRFAGLPDLMAIDLYADEYTEGEEDIEEDVVYKARRTGRYRLFWRLYDMFV